jgi:hypothetical protein
LVGHRAEVPGGTASLIPGRAYHEIARIGRELREAGGAFATAEPDYDVTVLYDSDSKFALSTQGPLRGDSFMPAPILDDMRTAHDIIAMLPDDVHAEVIEGEVIVNAATPAGRHAKIVLAVRRAFARHGIDNLFENTTLLVEHDEAEYVPDLARWPEHLIEGDTWEFPAAECAFALEVVPGDRPGRR